MSTFIPDRVARRVVDNCAPGAGGCLISNYSVGSHGYAQIGWQVKGHRFATTAHRAAWVAANGRQVPDGMTVDHLCHVRPCVNPEHLRLLDNVTNARDNGQVRVNQPTGQRWACGHEIVAAPGGRPYCRECNNAQRKRSRQKAA